MYIQYINIQRKRQIVTKLFCTVRWDCNCFFKERIAGPSATVHELQRLYSHTKHTHRSFQSSPQLCKFNIRVFNFTLNVERPHPHYSRWKVRQAAQTTFCLFLLDIFTLRWGPLHSSRWKVPNSSDDILPFPLRYSYAMVKVLYGFYCTWGVYLHAVVF